MYSLSTHGAGWKCCSAQQHSCGMKAILRCIIFIKLWAVVRWSQRTWICHQKLDSLFRTWASKQGSSQPTHAKHRILSTTVNSGWIQPQLNRHTNKHQTQEVKWSLHHHMKWPGRSTTRTCTWTCTHTRSHLHNHTCTHTHTHIHTCTWVCTHIHTHTCIHTFTQMLYTGAKNKWRNWESTKTKGTSVPYWSLVQWWGSMKNAPKTQVSSDLWPSITV